MNDWLNTNSNSILETAHRHAPFASDKTIEPHAPRAVAHMESNADLPQMANLLKDLKLPSFGGEEKEQTKDVINMFLHKWGDIYSLRRNPKVVRPIEASLLLTRKAYKWWMLLKECPCSWEEFNKVF